MARPLIFIHGYVLNREPRPLDQIGKILFWIETPPA